MKKECYKELCRKNKSRGVNTVVALLVGFVLAGTTNVGAQVRGMKDVYIGPEVGVGTSWVNELPGNSRFMPSGFAGINVLAFCTEYLAIGGQLNASSEGYRLSYPGVKEIERPAYVRLPLQAYHFWGDRYSRIRPDIHLGPSFAVKMAEYTTVITNKETPAPVPAHFEKYDAGVMGGIGMNMMLTRVVALNLDASYYQGLTDVIPDRFHNRNRNHVAGISAGLLVRISK